jgi:NADH-quinone oxidoreductase subunit L
VERAAHEAVQGAVHGAAAHGTVHGSAHASGGLELALMGLSVLVGVAGILLARRIYLQTPALHVRIGERLKGLYHLVYNKYFVDEAYEASIVRPGYKLSDDFLFGVIDVRIIDGLVNGVGIFARLFGSAVRLFQTGVVRTYALFFLFGLIYLVYKLVK